MPYVISLLPILVFLVTLVLLDTFRLVRFRTITAAILAGALGALISGALHPAANRLTSLQPDLYSFTLGPVIEESLKAGYVTWLIRTRRVGFMVDAAICGFAVGAGFALVENLFYLRAAPAAAPVVWVLRGCGTAAMHGSATALFGIVACRRTEMHAPLSPAALLPGLVLAVVLHGLYNLSLTSPLVAATLIVVVIPLVMTAVFRRSERGLRQWLDLGFDSDAECLAMLSSGNLAATRIGRYLSSVREILPAATVVDMFCLLRIHVELSLLAKGTLMMRKAGYEMPARPEITERFDELEHLKRSVGRAGWLTLRPLLARSHRELWQLTVLKGG